MELADQERWAAEQEQQVRRLAGRCIEQIASTSDQKLRKALLAGRSRLQGANLVAMLSCRVPKACHTKTWQKTPLLACHPPRTFSGHTAISLQSAGRLRWLLP